MKQRVSLITLAARDIEKLARFYESFGWERVEDTEGMVAFDLIGQTLGFCSVEALGEEIGVPEETQGLAAMALAHNVPSKEDATEVLHLIEMAGAKGLREAQDVFWGGNHGDFSDPKRHIWEMARNPHAPLGPKSEFQWEGFK